MYKSFEFFKGKFNQKLLLLSICGASAGFVPPISAASADGEIAKAISKTPTPTIAALVIDYQKVDKNAGFRFFNGHVDSFTTRPKSTIPDYATAIVKAYGLSLEAIAPILLPQPIDGDKQPKPGRDWDADSHFKLPYVPESAVATASVKGDDDAIEYSDKKVAQEKRTEPSPQPMKMLDWPRPDEADLQTHQKVALAVFQAFIERHQTLFEVDMSELNQHLELIEYTHGAFVKQLTFKQLYAKDEAVLYGKTLVQLDHNWNVVGVSRMLVTPEKVGLSKTGDEVSKEDAIKIASQAMAQCRHDGYQTLLAEPAVDIVRKTRVWNIKLNGDDQDCYWQTIVDRHSGKVLNVSDLIDRSYTDAKVNRWKYPGGDLYNPQQIISTGVYTRNNRRLEHDFFYMMNDNRCEGDPQASCPGLSHTTDYCEQADGSYNGSSFIRATKRADRDFSPYYPSGSSEAFGETNAYYWSRQYSQWQKPSLDALGLLPSSASDYPKVLVVTNSCRSGSVHHDNYAITTENNKGEGTNVIRLAHRTPSASSNRNASCEDGSCFDNPSNLHHELNHFYMKRYLGVGSNIDCSGGVELKYIHEGGMGTVMPHANWHHYYNVGYNPSSTNKLYFSDVSVGRVHVDNGSLMKQSSYQCVAGTNNYEAGRVLGQALWKIYHGKVVNGSTISNTGYPSTDRDFNILIFWAARMVAASTVKTRAEFAARVMEIVDFLGWDSVTRSDYCDIFDTHELGGSINRAHCN